MANSNWLLFVDEYGIGEQLAKRLEQAGHNVFMVRAGAAFAQVDQQMYQVASEKSADYDALLADLVKREQPPQHIVYLWSVTEGQTPDVGFPSLLSLAQSLEHHPLAGKLSLSMISNGLHQVSGEDVLSPAKATLWGVAKVISQENTTLMCRNIDIVWPQPTDSGKLSARLYAELISNSSESVVAYRGSYRWVQDYEAVHIEKPTQGSTRLRKGGSYLILGGTNRMGLILAEHLAENFGAKLTLVRDPGSTLHSFSIPEANLLVLDADGTNQNQVATAFAQAQTRFGRLDGVIQISDDFGKAVFTPIAATNKAEYETHFGITHRKLQTLAQVLADRQLDFCLVTSSLASVLGGLGLASYAANYSYVDAFVQAHNRTSLMPWVSVNWDSWKFADANSSLNERLDALSITPADGVELFERILACEDATQIIISTIDLKARLQEWVTSASDESAQAAKTVVLHARPNLTTLYVAPQNEVEQKIAEIWQALLGIETIGVHDNFFELGGHSLLAVQIISRMRAAFGIDLPLNNLFEQPTIAFLADYIATVRWVLQDQDNPETEGRQEIEL
jgi:NAD(P)-dependent dehydrogenase (short-subunit alcohol dehydrogenase family)/acyl carrier protein